LNNSRQFAKSAAKILERSRKNFQLLSLRCIEVISSHRNLQQGRASAFVALMGNLQLNWKNETHCLHPRKEYNKNYKAVG